MNKMMLVGMLLLSGVTFAADSSVYAGLFHDLIIDKEPVNGDENKAEAFTDCHMVAMGVYPTVLQDALYNTAADANDYAAARKAFRKLIGVEMSAGDVAKTNMNALIEQSQFVLDACIAGVQDETPKEI